MAEESWQLLGTELDLDENSCLVTVPGTGGVTRRPIDLAPGPHLAQIFPPAGQIVLQSSTDCPHLLDSSGHCICWGLKFHLIRLR